MNRTQLNWHSYKYYPYEKYLAEREVRSLLAPESIEHVEGGIVVNSPKEVANTERLVYFSSSQKKNENIKLPTRQALLEQVNGNGSNRQATRYSAHGMHEYKGKFNPQIAKALLNLLGGTKGRWALDPFCGSGTSLIEAAHLEINSVGTDINPLAVFLANSKLASLSISAKEIADAAEAAITSASKMTAEFRPNNARKEYLQSWFPLDVLPLIENLKEAIEQGVVGTQNILLALASNLLRDYSLQEPSDLRIRRRNSPLPDVHFFDAFRASTIAFSKKLAASQSILGLIQPLSRAYLSDCRLPLFSGLESVKKKFDIALTSPPYATALPYIDTQRLSLVWLGLIGPTEILSLEAHLVGSREVRGQSKLELLKSLEKNDSSLPATEAELCIELQTALTESDGFRRQAVPRLLYRYFSGMAASFSEVHKVMNPGARYGLIIGGNHTVLSGRRFDINTPNHLANLAIANGWTHLETIELQTYKRYGLHAKNAGTSEALVILQA